MPHSTASIPVFDLYGETHQVPGIPALHLETIATRSQPNNGVIRPHRHQRLLQILLIDHGDVQARLDAARYNFAGRCIIVAIPGQVHGFEFSASTSGHVLTIADNLLDASTSADIAWLRQHALARAIPEPASCRPLQTVITLIEAEIGTHASSQHNAVLLPLIDLAAHYIRRLAEAVNDTTEPPSGMASVRRFQALLDIHHAQHWRIGDYARALHLSTASLNRHCRAELSMSANEIIHQRLLLEAKRLLIYSDDSVEQIGERLGFQDPAYFSRFFKRLSGSTPTTWRSTMGTTQDQTGHD